MPPPQSQPLPHSPSSSEQSQEPATATLLHLKSALTHSLKQTGVYSSLETQLRASIYSTLNSATSGSASENGISVDLPSENYVINELILEYMKFNGYNHAASVLRSESGHDFSTIPPPSESNKEVESGYPVDFIQLDLGVVNKTGQMKGEKRIPCLYGIVDKLRGIKLEASNKVDTINNEIKRKEKATAQKSNKAEPRKVLVNQSFNPVYNHNQSQSQLDTSTTSSINNEQYYSSPSKISNQSKSHNRNDQISNKKSLSCSNGLGGGLDKMKATRRTNNSDDNDGSSKEVLNHRFTKLSTPAGVVFGGY